MAILTASADPAALARRARDMIHAGRPGAARPLIAALQRMAPDFPARHELAARLLTLENRLSEALEQMDFAVAADPCNESIRIGRADLRLRLDDAAGAAEDAAEAVIQDRQSPRAKAMLGAILLQLGHFGDAAACLAEAVSAQPRRSAFRMALAQAQERGGDAARAARTLDLGITLSPGDVGLRNASIMVAMRQRDFLSAVRIGEAARAAGVADASVFGLLGHALSSLGRHAEAAEAYCESCKLAPEDPYVRHLVTASGVLPQTDRAPADYVATVFDGYAERFESHLISLGYRVPGVVRGLMQGVVGAMRTARGPVLDLGCGTGLMGVVLSDLDLGPFTGVDLSEQMLSRAREKGVYEQLVAADIEAFLADCQTRWSLVLAADVFCYFGAVTEIFRQVFLRLAPGGVFVFSFEELEGAAPAAGWRLGRLGRYVQDPSYVCRTAEAAGFLIVHNASESLRTEAGLPVLGRIVAVTKPDHAG